MRKSLKYVFSLIVGIIIGYLVTSRFYGNKRGREIPEKITLCIPTQNDPLGVTDYVVIRASYPNESIDINKPKKDKSYKFTFDYGSYTYSFYCEIK